MEDPGKSVLRDINWTVGPGEFWVIGGLQGSGKTDFLMMAAGLMAPAAGTYIMSGEEMPIFEENRLKERLRIGLVFDGGQLFNRLTVAENVSLPLRYHANLSKERADEKTTRLLALTELTEWAASTPGAMGRNWRKRVGLARALMLRPDVLLLDNPLAGLDLRHRAWWLRFLSRLSAGHEWMENRKMTLIATADDLRPWRASGRKFAVLREERLIVLGGWDAVENSKDELVRELLAAAPQYEPVQK